MHLGTRELQPRLPLGWNLARHRVRGRGEADKFLTLKAGYDKAVKNVRKLKPPQSLESAQTSFVNAVRLLASDLRREAKDMRRGDPMAALTDDDASIDQEKADFIKWSSAVTAECKRLGVPVPGWIKLRHP